MGIVKFGLIFVLLAVCAATTASADDKKPSKPTGACTISVYGVTPTCTSPMTQESCNATAKKVGGTADWKEGQSCPKK